MLEESEDFDDWKKYEYDIHVPQEMELRLQLNIIEPGVFWVDDIKIKELDN